MRTLFKKIGFLMLVILIQFSLLGHFSMAHYLDLLLVLLFFWSLSFSTKHLYLLAFLGGLLSDIFSGYPLGVKTFLYLSFCFTLVSVKQNFLRNFNHASFFALLILAFSFFEIVKTSLFIGLGIEISFRLLVLSRILANSLLAILITLGSKRIFFRV